MKNIIVPVDFSYNSKDALEFACQIAPIYGHAVKVIHVYTGSFTTQEPLVIKAGMGRKDVVEEQLAAFINGEQGEGSIQVKPHVKVSWEAVSGQVVRRILQYGEAEDTAMIIMGTTGSSNWVDRFFGSISTTVSRSAACPVLLIPKGVVFNGFNQVLFASNYESVNPESIQQIKSFAQQFETNVHFVHIAEKEEKLDSDILEEQLFSLLFDKETPTFAFSVTEIFGPKVVEGLNTYSEENAIDLTVMVSPQRTFWQTILHQSTTRAMAFTTEKPILVV